MSISEDLERLARLRESGDLTAAEYRHAKKELLGLAPKKRTPPESPQPSPPPAQSHEVSGTWFTEYGDNGCSILLSAIAGGLVAWLGGGLGLGGWIAGGITFCLAYVVLVIYSLPVSIARRRGHPNVMAITVLTFFGAWTGILWIAALVWAVSEPRSR